MTETSPLCRGLVALAAAILLLHGTPEAGGTERTGPIQPTDSISYHLEAVPEDLEDRYTDEQLGLLEKLNRADREGLSGLNVLVVPDRWDARVQAHSPLPQALPELALRATALVVHQPLQVFGAYEKGRLVRWGPVSTGRREYPTPSGLFHLNWRSRGRHSTLNPDWYMEWYFNFHNERGLSLHQYALPGEPASRACVRLLERDARWIYDWGEQWVLDDSGQTVLEPGTPLWILGAYDFDAPPPWLDSQRPHPSVDLRIEESASGHPAEGDGRSRER